MKISAHYNSFLAAIQNPPRIISEVIKLGQLNTTEVPGPKSNEEIIALAKEAGVDNIYKSDETAWCAVAATVLCLRSGKDVPFMGWDRLRAKSFEKFGVPVKEPMLGDILVFIRYNTNGTVAGYHVGVYVAEDPQCYHVAGGNQSNQFNVIRVTKARAIAFRRPVYNIQPESVKKIFVDASGNISGNEA